MRYLFLCACILALTVGVKGQGYMRKPVNRGAVWAYFPSTDQTNKNLDYASNMNCGGRAVNDVTYKSCDPCGGAPPGDFAVEFYNEAQEIHVDLEIIDPMHEDGSYVFDLCETDASFTVTHDCFRRKLTWSNTGIVNIPASRSDGLNTYSLKLPDGFQCQHCVLRWKWADGERKTCASSTGTCHKVVTNCADVTIGSKSATRPTDMLEPSYSAYVSIDTGGSSEKLTLDNPSNPSGDSGGGLKIIDSKGGLTITGNTGGNTGTSDNNDDDPQVADRLSLPGTATAAAGVATLASGETLIGLTLLGLGAYFLLNDHGAGYQSAGFIPPGFPGSYQFNGGLNTFSAQGYPYTPFSSGPPYYLGTSSLGFSGASAGSLGGFSAASSLPVTASASGLGGISATNTFPVLAPAGTNGGIALTSQSNFANMAPASFSSGNFLVSPPSISSGPMPPGAQTFTSPDGSQFASTLSSTQGIASGSYVPPSTFVTQSVGASNQSPLSSAVWSAPGLNMDSTASFSTTLLNSPTFSSVASVLPDTSNGFQTSFITNTNGIFNGASAFQGGANVPFNSPSTSVQDAFNVANAGVSSQASSWGQTSGSTISGTEFLSDASAAPSLTGLSFPDPVYGNQFVSNSNPLLPTLNHYNFATAQMPLVANAQTATFQNQNLASSVQQPQTSFSVVPSDVVQRFDSEPLPTRQRETHQNRRTSNIAEGPNNNMADQAHQKQSDVVELHSAADSQPTSAVSGKSVKDDWLGAITNVKKMQKEYRDKNYCHCKTHLNVLTVFCMSKDGDEESCGKYPCYCEFQK